MPAHPSPVIVALVGQFNDVALFIHMHKELQKKGIALIATDPLVKKPNARSLGAALASTFAKAIHPVKLKPVLKHSTGFGRPLKSLLPVKLHQVEDRRPRRAAPRF